MTRENKDFINRLNLKFGEIDKRAENFINKFSKIVKPMVLAEFPNIDSEESLMLSINDYAIELFSFTHSSIDKDNEYSDFKKNEELKALTSLVNRLSNDFDETEFSTTLHNKAKSLIIDEFAEIYDLSSYGFLILERYAKLKNMAFIAVIKRLIDNQ
ncbi:hypothetical protein [Plebeiibacterium sediminum]|uniref:Uncharacterized protein n=1 Tax=Plebeiibacterium sediminum TaxID=2992112 RepID=A0AAE3M504_9BACT|nr:hypothetical protein [Plebeiobacterium sediminum]MCW3786935.1 hypothetical protein [Plebeiobacterium sediminum]